MGIENKLSEKFTKTFATLVGFATAVLLNSSPVVGENLISTKDQLTCKLGPDQQMLVIKNPKPEQKAIVEIVCLLLMDIPEFIEIPILNDEKDPQKGSYNPISKTINLKLSDIKEDGKKAMVENTSNIEIIRKRIGFTQEILEKYPEFIVYFTILHEFGHAQMNRLLYLDYKYYEEKYPELHKNSDTFLYNLFNLEEGRMPLPNLSRTTITRNHTYVSPRLLENQARYYRYKLSELYSDRFAAKYLFEYLKLTNSEVLAKEAHEQYKINTEYTDLEGLRKLVHEFLIRDRSWFLKH